MIAHLPGIALSALYATVTALVLGGLFFGALRAMRDEYTRHPALYRTKDQMMKLMPLAMISMYVGAFAATFIYAMGFREGTNLVVRGQFSVMLAIFVVCGFVLHNHVNLAISTRLTVYQAIAYFLEWLVVGLVISLTYHG
jgi:hypothetical protein